MLQLGNDLDDWRVLMVLSAPVWQWSNVLDVKFDHIWIWSTLGCLYNHDVKMVLEWKEIFKNRSKWWFSLDGTGEPTCFTITAAPVFRIFVCFFTIKFVWLHDFVHIVSDKAQSIEVRVATYSSWSGTKKDFQKKCQVDINYWTSVWSIYTQLLKSSNHCDS